MALPATDSFTGTNNDPLSGNWTTVDGAFKIFSNQAVGNDAGDSIVYWNADAFANNQYAQAKVYNIAGWVVGPMVRVASVRGYAAQAASATEMKLYRFDAAGNATLLQTVSSLTIVNGDLIRLEAEGTTLRMYQNAVQRGTDQTDATYASGSAGMMEYAANCGLDDWEGGNLGGGGGSSAPKLMLLGVGAVIAPAVWRWQRMRGPG